MQRRAQASGTDSSISSPSAGNQGETPCRANNKHSNSRQQWDTDPRWKGIKRTYTAEDVVRLRGSLQVEHTLAKRGAEKLWESVDQKSRSSTRSAR